MEVNLREPEESDYGWAYLNPYLVKEDGQKRPAYQALEQIFREHEIYKTITENMTNMYTGLSSQLDKIQKEAHFTLLRSGDAEKSARTLLHLWNSFNFDSNVTSYLPMSELVTPPMEQAMNEVAQYYKELSEKKRSRAESIVPTSDDNGSKKHDEKRPEKEETNASDFPDLENLRTTFSDWLN